MNEDELKAHRELQFLRETSKPARTRKQQRASSIRASKLAQARKEQHMAKSQKTSASQSDAKAQAKVTAESGKGVATYEFDPVEAFLKETQGGNTTLSDTTIAALRVKFTDSERVTPVKLVGDVLTEPNAEQKRAGFLNPSEAPTEMRDGTLSNTGYKKSDAANEDDPEGSQAVEDDDAANVEPDAPKGQFSGQ